MPRIRLWAALLVALVAIAGCASWFKGQHTEETPKDRAPAYVDRVDGPAVVPANQPFTLTVAGSLPTPAWKLDDAEIRRDGRHILITLWSRRVKHGPVIQMIVPFTRTIQLPGLAPGRYDIEVRGRADTTRHLDVQVQ